MEFLALPLANSCQLLCQLNFLGDGRIIIIGQIKDIFVNGPGIRRGERVLANSAMGIAASASGETSDSAMPAANMSHSLCAFVDCASFNFWPGRGGWSLLGVLDENASCLGKNGGKRFSGDGKHARSMTPVGVDEGRMAPSRDRAGFMENLPSREQCLF